MRTQADVAHRVAGCVQALQLYGFTYFDDVTRLHAAAHARDFAARFVVRNDLRACRGDHGIVTAGVVVVLMRVQNLCDLPAFYFGRGQRLFRVQRVNRQRLAGLGAGDQVVEVAVGVVGPDALDDHVLSKGEGFE